MTTTHLMGRSRILCHTQAVNPTATAALSDVACRWCLRALEALAVTEAVAAWERQYEATSRAVCEGVGIAHLYDRLGDTPSERMLRHMVASVARYFAELDATEDAAA